MSTAPEDDDAADAAAAADVQRAKDQVASLDTPPPPAPAPAPAEAAGERKLQPLYPSVQAWVEGVFAVVFVRRATNTFRWCREWWRHPEAIVRLEALWRSWELLRLDPTTGMGVWFRDHLDHSMPILTGPAGPFADCDPSQHYDPETSSLPVDPAPEDWWDIPAADPADEPAGTEADDRTPS